MAYFLKKAKLKGRTYLSIVESYYSVKPQTLPIIKSNKTAN